MHQLALIILFISIIQINYACYITNCPIGGKRSLHFDNNLVTHQCPRCGLHGQCFGPSICCTDLACRIGHPSDIRQCSVENRSLIPCTTKTSVCSTVPNGQCAANGVCCSTEFCQMDETCLIQESDKSHEEHLEPSEFMFLYR